MKKSQVILFCINLLLITGFSIYFLLNLNYEFIIYVGVIIFFLVLIVFTRNKVDYTLSSLIGLTIWSLLHLCGGCISVGENERLYELIIVKLSSTLPILRYDQVVHMWGFGVSTIVMYSLLRKSLVPIIQHKISLGIVLVLSGLGVGAFNEILEFIVELSVPESGVGGYINTALDLCANLIGSLLAVIYINVIYLKPIKT
ncbi:MAG: DUF2238 domain-containing protein [Chitinispirillaceae bacterium]|nr:DUF2238 domain-containing protein [Chitinispirillaceae bacterium]